MPYEIFISQDKGPPDAVSENGYEFRIETYMTKVAKHKLGKDWKVCLVSKDGKDEEYVILKGSEPLYGHQTFEAVMVLIDMLKFSQEREKNEG